MRDMLLQDTKKSTSDVLKGEIQRQLEQAEGRIHDWNEKANKCESEVDSREERMGLLKKKGEYIYENATNTTNTAWMVIFVITKIC